MNNKYDYHDFNARMRNYIKDILLRSNIIKKVDLHTIILKLKYQESI